MNFNETKIAGVYIIEQSVFEDERGFFVKTFHENTFKDMGLESNFRESYYSESHKNVIRGMHFQTPDHDHAKIATTIIGKVHDVILDLRKNSETFGQYIEVELSRENRKSVYIPRGCAHGFAAIEDNSVVYYMTSSVYSPEHDSGVRWDSFGAEWPVSNPIISKRDSLFPEFKNYKSPF